MARRTVFNDVDDGVSPHGRKQPLAFLAPTLKLLAPGSSIMIAKFPPSRIHRIAERIGVKVRLDVQTDRIRLTVVEKAR